MRRGKRSFRRARPHGRGKSRTRRLRSYGVSRGGIRL